MRMNLRSPHGGSMLPDMVGAVIYVRVSTKEQTENLSLATQLKACENYCERQGFEVLARFPEEGESAKTADRTELQKLLQFCRTNKGAVQFVVVFNLTRFARQVRPFRAACASEVPRDLSAICDRADRRHVHREVDGRRARGVRAVRQRLSLGPDPRRHEGRTGARALDVSRSPWLPERAPFDRPEPDSRSGTSAAGATRLPGFREWTFHEARGPQQRQRPRLDDATRQAGPFADVRRHAAEPRLHRADRRP